MIVDRVAIIGAGRVGLTLARALIHSGADVRLLGRHSRTLPEWLLAIETDWGPAIAAADLVLVAVPDDAIADVARTLATSGTVAARQIILHTSGLCDRTELAALDATGAALGSLHPLQTFAVPDGDPEALRGSPAAIEGDARALAAARAIAERLQLSPIVEIAAGGKPAYHAAAVFASNYQVVLADIAVRLARAAGAGDVSAELFLPLMRRTLDNYGIGGAAALTGPISRGDTGTVARHLDALTGADRALYVMLGREALRLARAAGLDERNATAIDMLLY